MDTRTRASPPGRPAQRTNRLKLHMRKFREAQSEDVSKQDWPLLLEDGDAVSGGYGHRKPHGRGSDRVFLLERSGRRPWRFRAGSAGWTAQSLAMPVSCSAPLCGRAGECPPLEGRDTEGFGEKGVPSAGRSQMDKGAAQSNALTRQNWGNQGDGLQGSFLPSFQRVCKSQPGHNKESEKRTFGLNNFTSKNLSGVRVQVTTYKYTSHSGAHSERVRHKRVKISHAEYNEVFQT